VKKIRLLIVEDSPTVCVYLGLIFAEYDDIEIVAVAKNGREGINFTIDFRPDIVLMDLHMPEVDGFAATHEIMSRCPTPIIIITATGDPQDKFLSIKALECGAVGLLEKPAGLNHGNSKKQVTHLINHIRALSDVKTVQFRRKYKTHQKKDLEREIKRTHSIIAIATSTGGPQALAKILTNLDDTFPLPILLVQHIAPDFANGFAEWLQSVTKLKVIVAKGGERIYSGKVYLCTNDSHIGITSNERIFLSSSPAINGFRPSANYLFESVGRALGDKSLALILTGMGNDGIKGLTSLKQAGGYVVAQDESSSVVFGMPKAAIDANLADDIFELNEIAQWLHQMQNERNDA
tara:strand:+ start:8618 stop:9664 length:1047 start_codon:yes stop_codon:yes gene_type:complete